MVEEVAVEEEDDGGDATKAEAEAMDETEAEVVAEVEAVVAAGEDEEAVDQDLLPEPSLNDTIRHK
jgi:hypothetical protein